MKREICCDECAKQWQQTMRWSQKGRPGEFPGLNAEGEGMRQVVGTPWASLTCDGCGAELPDDKPATAVSLYSAERPYFAWESEYLLTVQPC